LDGRDDGAKPLLEALAVKDGSMMEDTSAEIDA
jgi:hypothetical protein